MNTIYTFLIVILIGGLLCVVIMPHKNNNLIYDQVSQDHWGQSIARDSIKEEFEVTIEMDSIVVVELEKNSVFFREFVKDSIAGFIKLKLYNTNFKSTEYWGTVVKGDSLLCCFREPVDYVFVQAHSGMVRLIFEPSNPAAKPFVYLFYPSED